MGSDGKCEVGRLRAELAEKDKHIEGLEQEQSRLNDVIKRVDDRIEELEAEAEIPALAAVEAALGGIFITNEQIDKAWEYATHPSVGPDAIWVLKRFGIVACEGCGGWKVVSDE